MKNVFPPRRTRRHSTAFSLVEVVLALGIIAVAVVSMLGLMPIGLSTLREGMNATTKEQVIQQIVGEAMMTPFSKLDAYVSNGPYYFDDGGSQQAGQDATTRFKVTLVRAGTVYPWATSSAQDVTGSVTTLQVQLSAVPGNAPVGTYAICVPNSGSF